MAGIVRFLRTVRHFPLSALLHRLDRRCRQRVYRPAEPPGALKQAWPQQRPVFSVPLFDRLQHAGDRDPECLARIEALSRAHSGLILNEPFALPQSPDDREELLAGKSDLWRENYAYLEFLHPLIFGGPGSEAESVLPLIERQCELLWDAPWAVRNGSVYGVARRMLVYFEIQPLLAQASPGFARRFAAEYYRDTRHLIRFLEWDVRGNHLIKNLKAWLAASLFFLQQPATAREAERWERQLIRLLPDIFTEQILPDGFHMERTPMYHAWVLVDLLDCLSLMSWREGYAQAIERMRPLARRMLDALPVVFHVSGQPALFGDSSLPQTPSLFAMQIHGESVLATAGAPETGIPPSHALSLAPKPMPAFAGLPEAGFSRFGMHTPEASLILDSGDFGPRSLPAHSHCDLGSFEVHVGNRPIIVDGGISEYAPGMIREYFRSTGAHNTLWVPGEEQAELWSSFRVAAYPDYQGQNMAHDEGGAKVTVSYENHNNRYHHQRSVYSVLNEFWVVQDWIRHLAPAGRECYSLLHVPADCDINLQNDSFDLGQCLLVIPFGGRKLAWTGHSPWQHNHLNLISPGFSQAAPGQVIAMTPKPEDCFGWVLVPYVAEARPRFHRIGEGIELILPLKEKRYRMTWDSEGLHVAFQGQAGAAPPA